MLSDFLATTFTRIPKLPQYTYPEATPRSLFSAPETGGSRQVFATPDRVLARVEALRSSGELARPGGQRRTTYVSLFSGMAGATAALERIGSDAVPLAFAETDAAANSLLRYRWPDVPRVGDVAQFDTPATLTAPSGEVAGPRHGSSPPQPSKEKPVQPSPMPPTSTWPASGCGGTATANAGAPSAAHGWPHRRQD